MCAVKSREFGSWRRRSAVRTANKESELLNTRKKRIIGELWLMFDLFSLGIADKFNLLWSPRNLSGYIRSYGGVGPAHCFAKIAFTRNSIGGGTVGVPGENIFKFKLATYTWLKVKPFYSVPNNCWASSTAFTVQLKAIKNRKGILFPFVTVTFALTHIVILRHRS